MYIGTESAPAMLDLEAQHGHKWRPGSKSRWLEVRLGWEEIRHVAGMKDAQAQSPLTLKRHYLVAAKKLDEDRMSLGPRNSEMGFPSHLKKVIMPKYSKSARSSNEHSDRSPA